MQIVAEDDAASIDLAVQALRRGHLVAFPTDTVYGVAALAADEQACSALFSAKGRPPERAIPIFIPSIDLLGEVASGFGEAELRLARAGLPGPLTIVLRRAPAFRSAALVGDDTVGVRIPNHRWVLALLRTL
ncbi:MAG TPA: Sua5/YciO/YrdC/YwlC family protein, partial [Dehalococcoidia bacterium]|nr:Sua5/YciO/YrdC/YwlC family protein [Dehalococcoidia bacterium]